MLYQAKLKCEKLNLKFLYLVLLAISCSILSAQKADTLVVVKADSMALKKAKRKAIYSSARKATILSAILPGSGQLYNRKYWKAPIVYAALGGLAYWGITNQKQYKFYSDNLRAIYDEDEATQNSTLYTSDQLITQKNYYKKYRDVSIMFGALVYVLNIIDANVDAHLKSFDVSDDLSLQLKPYTNYSYNNTLQTGLTIKLKFK